jgi:hypothetical protein
VVDDELGDDPQAALVRRGEEGAEVVESAEVRINVVVIRDVISVIAHRRRIKRKEPKRSDPELLEII